MLRENVDEDVFFFGKGLGKVEVDLMVPLDPEKSPKVNKPQLNHIGFWVDDLEKCVKYLEGINKLSHRAVILILENQIKVVGGIRPGASGFNITFVHPKSACGVLVELVQAPPDVIEEYNKI